MKQGWEIKRLDDLCQIELGKTPYRADKSFWDTEKKTDNVWLSIADLLNTDGDVVSDSKEYITDKAAKISKVVKKGTLLLSFKLTLGRLAFAGRDLFTNEAIAALSIKDEKVIDKYFLYQFLSLYDWNAATEGDVKVKGKTLNKAKLKEIEVHFPKSLPEQQRIVSILDEAFAAIAKAKANAEQNLKNAKELFESYLQGVFENGNWEMKTIQEITKVVNGYAFASKDFKPTNTIKSVKITNVGVKEFVEEADNYLPEKFKETLKDFQVREGNIVIALTRTIISAGLKVAVVPESYDGALVNQRVAALVPNEKLVNQNFLYYFLTTSGVAKYVLAHVNTLMQPNLSINDLKNLPVPCPPLKEQQTIVRQLDALRAETQKLEAVYQKKIADLEELKKSILQKAFAGELRSPEGAEYKSEVATPLADKKPNTITSPEGV